jgi:hypothetical protein
MVAVDNFVSAGEGYKNLRIYLEDPKNGFKMTTAPYGGGLLIAIYVGPQ